MSGLIDPHSHVLPGVDDGVADLDTAIAMLIAMRDSGASHLWATPHVAEDEGYPGSPERLQMIRERFDELLGFVPDGLTVRLGYEVTPSLEQLSPGADVRSFALEGLDLVLVDGPDDEPAAHDNLLLPYIARIGAEGLRAVLAHPERRAAHPTPDPGFAERLTDAGALLQVDAGALLAREAPAVGAEAWRLVADGLASLVGSDAHDLPDATDLGSAHAAIAEQLDTGTADRLCRGLALTTTPLNTF